VKPIQMSGEGLSHFQFGTHLTFKEAFHFLQEHPFLQVLPGIKSNTISIGRLTQEAT
jgi:hypothetical protein